jgi:MarR family transcriptional regulator, organic hydroperoxide resistance regulator
MTPNDTTDRETLLARVMTGFDAFMQRMSATHAPEFSEIGLTMSQAKVLYLVQASAPIGLSELAGRLGVGVSTASGLVERLVEAGLVDRRDDPADRRHVLLSLTDTGTASLDRMRELNTGHMRLMLEHVSDADLATIDRAIRALTEAAVAMTPSRLAPIHLPAASAARKEPS